MASLDQELVEVFKNRIVVADNSEELLPQAPLNARGLVVCSDLPDTFLVTVAAFILFSPHPANHFPQCEILVDAYDDIRITGRPKGQLNVNAPLPRALNQILKFIDDHTFHPRRVVGLNNIRLDEYPVTALREVLLNAVAHRDYDDAARKVFVRIFRNRIEIASPGYPLKPLTLAKLRRGSYRPCSRNPLIAQTLATLDKMEQRGSGFARMRDAMLDHGLDEPKLDQQDGFFVVTLPGSDGTYDRIRMSASIEGAITPAIEARLSERQRQILIHLQQEGFVTNKWVQETLNVVRDTAYRDIHELLDLKLIEKTGSGRSTRYIIIHENV